MSRSKLMLSVLAASLTLAGCGSLGVAVGPDYQRPVLETPKTWVALPAQDKAAANVNLLSWWKSFQDPVLNSLLDEAVANNQDLVLAAGRIEEARATATGTRSNRFPVVDATLSGNKSRTSENAGKLAAGANPSARIFKSA
jgi:outer membrane protein TolC